MTRPEATASTPEAPDALVVLGAAGGIGRWLCAHLFGTQAWDEVVLLDVDPAVHRLDLPFTARTGVISYDDGVAITDAAGVTVGLPDRPAAVCLAVPQTELARVAAALLGAVHADSTVFDTGSSKVGPLAILQSVRSDVTFFGIHPLFGPTVPSMDGQTVVICPSPDPAAADAHAWLVDLIQAAGGVTELTDAPRHDQIMAYVQAAAHQALLTFADVIANCGHDIERDLWTFRTPLFETLLSLASRVLSPGQERTIAAIQTTTEGARIAAELDSANARLRSAVGRNEPAEIEAYIRSRRDAFGGTFFTTLQQASNLAVEAAQVNRTLLAATRRSGDVVALRHHTQESQRLTVGLIEELTPTTVTLTEVLTGPKGRAALLLGPGITNARKLGVAAKQRRRVTFGLSHVTILSATETDEALDDWLGRVRLDVRLLVPENIAGQAVVAMSRTVPHIDAADLVGETVRWGQREVVARIAVRADKDAADVAADLVRRVDEVYRWPTGAVAPLAAALAGPIAFLGPTGTFSEVAARRAAELVGAQDAPLAAHRAFEDLVAAVADRSAGLGVLPILNSSSGLVDRSAAALRAVRGVVAGGVIDVPVRFDAYAPRPDGLVRGAPVLSHPQALAQCSRFIAAHGLQPEETESTASACVEVTRRGEGIALAASVSAAGAGLATVATNVGDLAGVLTRFLILGAEAAFGEAGDAALVRALHLVGEDLAAARRRGQGSRDLGNPRFDEVIVGKDGQALLVTTEPLEDAGGVYLGRLPWSPRTPIVRV